MSPQTALWRAVILQHLDDAMLVPDENATSKNMKQIAREKFLLRQQARSWFCTRDFIEVCEMADTSPHTIMRELHRREAHVDAA